MFNAYKINEINQNRFYQVPKELFENPKYKNKLNSDAKLLYALLLDRMELSRKNDWVNENGEIYLLFSRENIQEILGISKPTSVKAFKQLTDLHLIKEVRQGLGKPNIIYIGKINYAETQLNQQKSKIFTSGSKENLPLEVKNFNPNDTYISETNNENDNGAKSKDICTLIDIHFDSETVEVIGRFMNDLYKQRTGKLHPRLKKEQYSKVHNSIHSYMQEWGLSGEDILNMMVQFLNSDIDTDYNINHFATDGIMVNRMYEAAY